MLVEGSAPYLIHHKCIHHILGVSRHQQWTERTSNHELLRDRSLKYRIEGNIGGGKLWRIWRTTINSPKFNSPIFVLKRVLTYQ